MSISLSDNVKGKAAKIPRPMNAFMIFAKEHRPKVKKEHPTEENHVISIRLGNMWANLSGEEKDRYQDLSREAANEHRRKYPDYRYEPKPKIKKKRRYDQYLMMDRLRTAAAEAAREKKEQQEKTKSLTVVQTSNPTSVTTSKGGYYSTSLPTWQIVNSPLPSHPRPLSDSPTNYTQGYNYPSHPNIIPAHSQVSRHTHISQPYHSIMSDPYHLPFTPGFTSPEMNYLNQPLDMTTASSNRQFKIETTTTEPTGKVYCDLSTPAHRKTPSAVTQFLQKWSGERWSSRPRYPCQWGQPINTVAPPTGVQRNIRPGCPPLPSNNPKTVNHTPSSGSSMKPGNGKADLVWIPCEPDFARKLGWSLDPSVQGGYQSSQH